MMTLIYDRDVFQKFRALAVTEVSQLVPGKTYYSNYQSPFTFVRVLTQKEFHSLPGPFNCLLSDTDDDVKPKWILAADESTHSLSDNNIGTSYNPWLIFEDRETAERCEGELKVTFQRDPFDYQFDDFDHHYDDRDEYEDA